MVFSSLYFLYIFLPVVLILYYALPRTSVRNCILLLASIIFYAWGEPVYVFLMIFSILINYVLGLDIARSGKIRKRVQFVVAILINLGLLGFFKYYGFVVENINALAGLHLRVRELALPIGISFYTFQILSYIIDVYRGQVAAQKNLIRFALYVTMFPQLIAGPIVRYDDIEQQLTSRNITLARFAKGCERFILGLGKKVLLANNLGQLSDAVFALETRPALAAWLGLIAYAMQIYFDFSGYSDMAIGLGDMLGFTFLENFRYPYLSKSITEFWRRWHISLGTWFREYVYIPLGGNRVCAVRHILNILIVWTLTGLWHGASWNFVLWGLYYGLLLLLEKYFFAKRLDKIPVFFRHLYTLILVLFGWLLFASTDLSAAGRYFLDLFGRGGFCDTASLYQLIGNGILLLIGGVCCCPFVYRFYRKKTHTMPALTVATTTLLFIVCTAFLVYNSYNPFLYFRF